MKKQLFFGILLLLFIGCAPSSPKIESEEFFSPAVCKILDFQDHRNGDSILPYLIHNKEDIREKAALAFASIQEPKFSGTLLNIYTLDSSTKVKKACIYAVGQIRDSNNARQLIDLFAKANKNLHFAFLDAIGKCGGKETHSFFQELQYDKAVSDKDYSQGLMRYAFANKEYEIVRPHIWTFLNSESLDARRNGATLLPKVFKEKSNFNEQELLKMDNILSIEKDSNVLKILYAFMDKIKNPKENTYSKATPKEYNAIKEPYNKAEFLMNLVAKEYDGLDFLLATALSKNHKAVKTAAANSLINALANPKLTINKKPKSYYLTSLLEEKDMALQSVATYGIKNSNIISKEEAKIVFLEKLKSLAPTYENPRQKETYLDIINTIAYLNNEPKPAIETEYNHPINWYYVRKIPADQKVKITTTKGEIILECKVHDAPGSVSNFLKLVDSGYYNNKAFHRVVPNFVIQTGCNRGDGWGAPDWTQRSEFSNYLTYTTGAVGLASAGKDTESIQWFITHTYTPFLDGRYSIFAYVTKGMEVVAKMEVGDMVLQVERL